MSFSWDTESDWQNAQDSEDVTIDGGTFSLASAIPDSVVNRYPIDEGSGTTVADTISGDDGSFVSGPTWNSRSDAIGGYELAFDGIDDGVNTLADSPTGSRTLYATVDITLPIGGGGEVIQTFNSADFAAGSHYLRFADEGTENQLQYEAFDDSGTLHTATFDLSSGGRYRVVGVLDTTASEIRLGVNGSFEDTTDVSGSNFTTAQSGHAFGYERARSARYTEMALDEPMVGNDAIGVSALSDDYNRQPWS